MYRLSKYLRCTNTNLKELHPGKTYRFTGTFDGVTVYPKQSFDYVRHVFSTELQPVLSFSDVTLNQHHFNYIKFTYREMLTKVPLNRGDVIVFDTRLKQYKRGGLYSGDLLVSVRNLRNDAQKITKPSVRYRRNKDHALYDLVVNGGNIYYYSLTAPGNVSNCLYTILTKQYGSRPYRNRAVKGEVELLLDLIPDFPSVLGMYANCFPHTKIDFVPPSLTNFDHDTYEGNLFQQLQSANEKGRLITAPKWRKLRTGSGTDVFYILLNALKRSRNFLTKAKD